MTWHGTKTWAVGEGPWSATIMNRNARDNLQYCRDAQRIVIGSAEYGTSWNNAASTSPENIGGVDAISIRHTDVYAYLNLRCWLQGFSTAASSIFKFGVFWRGGEQPDGYFSSGVRTFCFNVAGTKQIYFEMASGTLNPGIWSAQPYVYNTFGTGAFSVNTAISYHMELTETNIFD